VYFKPSFFANFKIATVITIPEISQYHSATSADFLSKNYVQVRQGNMTVTTSLSPCTPSPLNDPLINPEFDCYGMLGYGIVIGRNSHYTMGICSIGLLTDCKC
jgi:hypothetical protein